MDLYSAESGSTAQFTLSNAKTKATLAEVKGKNTGPISLTRRQLSDPLSHPQYEVVTVSGVIDVIEYRQPGPVFYLSDDPAVWSQLGAGTPPVRK
jgi:hypothetical protein